MAAPHRPSATLFQEPGLVQHQHRLPISQLLEDVAAQLVADGLGLPWRPPQHVLEAIGGGVTAHFRQLPAVLALGRTQQPAPRGHRPLPRLGPLEIGRQAAFKIVEVGRPALDHGDVQVLGRREIVVGRHHGSSSPNAIGTMRLYQKFSYLPL